MRQPILDRCCAFTLVEVVVVVMILGVLAAIAAPRVLGTADTAIENGARQSLSVIRMAIDCYGAEHPQELPGDDGQEATFVADLAHYLRGAEFPACAVGAAKNNRVRMAAGTGSITSGISSTATTHSWVYKYETGEFYINSSDVSDDGITTYVEF
jgi:general secretion pathway protein G